MTSMLALSGVTAGYGDLIVDRDVSFDVAEASVTVLLGPNGAGKSTLLKTVAGLIQPKSGSILFNGVEIAKESPYKRRNRGLGLVQENKRIFKRLTVEQNVVIGGFGLRLSRAETASRLEESYERFPILRDKRSHVAGYLSGGQQQMLAISQALFSHPTMLMLDEPFSGLAPSIVQDVMETIKRLRTEEGRTLLVVEQAVDLALSMADSVLLLDVGRIVHRGLATDADIRQVVQEAYFGTKI